jgi:hypothetical protein
MAVASASVSRSMALRTRSRSVPGGTSTVADPAKETRPRLIGAGSWPTNDWAAALAASSREGWTSVASIEMETSMARMIVARSLGTCSLRVGRARATTIEARARSRRAAGTWRRHPGRRGATDASSATFVKRTA